MRDLLEQIDNQSRKTTRTDLSEQLKLKLISQMKGEERHFYSLLVQIRQARHEFLESSEEHHFAELVLKELDKLDAAEGHEVPEWPDEGSEKKF